MSAANPELSFGELPMSSTHPRKRLALPLFAWNQNRRPRNIFPRATCGLEIGWSPDGRRERG